MLKHFIDELSGKGLGTLVGMLFGGLLAWLAGYWRRYQERRSILDGDARDMIANRDRLRSLSRRRLAAV
jgi:hypothetical protein